MTPESASFCLTAFRTSADELFAERHVRLILAELLAREGLDVVQAQGGGLVDGIVEGELDGKSTPGMPRRQPSFSAFGAPVGQFGGQQARAAQAGQSKPDADGAGGFQKTATIHVKSHGGTFQKRVGGWEIADNATRHYTAPQARAEATVYQSSVAPA